MASLILQQNVCLHGRSGIGQWQYHVGEAARQGCFSTMSGMPEVPLPWRALVQKRLRPAAGPLLLPKVKQMANSFSLRRCLQLQ